MQVKPSRGFRLRRAESAPQLLMADVKAPLDSETANALERAFRTAAAPGLLSAYLFGSHAEGRSHRESDLDVGVLLSHDVHPTARLCWGGGSSTRDGGCSAHSPRPTTPSSGTSSSAPPTWLRSSAAPSG